MAPSSRGNLVSATSGRTLNPDPAPWKPDFLSHIQKMDSPEFVLSTLHRRISHRRHQQSQETPTEEKGAIEPRARYCIFRGMWAELPVNKHNKASLNRGGVYESEMVTCTTDIRMGKVGDLETQGGDGDGGDSSGETGGGPVEAVFWVKEVGTQWRIRGRGFVVGPDVEKGGGETTKREMGKRMRVVVGEEEERDADWSWERELTAHFGNNSPGIRGSFRAPPPGRPVNKPYDDKLKLGDKLDSLDDEVARANFRVLAVLPEEVEQLDLSDPKTARRWLFTYNADKGKWSQEEQWP